MDGIVSDSEYFVLPGLKDRIELTKPQAAAWGRPDDKETAEWFEGLREAEEEADGIVVNSFQELELDYVEEFAKAKDKKVWCIGPVSLCNKSLLDLTERGSKAGINGHDCLKWLDLRESGLVIYVCLGSLTRACIEQNIELGLGLESSNVSFIWGIIVRGWAPQVLILSHPVVGGFLTHCGWNSTLEGVSAELPMVTWPQFADQFLNERFIVNILKIGVKIGMEVPVTVGEQTSVLVKKDNIMTAVKDIMGKEEEGEARRKRAKELAEMSNNAMEEGGSFTVIPIAPPPLCNPYPQMCVIRPLYQNAVINAPKRRYNSDITHQNAVITAFWCVISPLCRRYVAVISPLWYGYIVQSGCALWPKFHSKTNHQKMANLHFVLFPLMAQGHMIPMVDIARLLARRGATVTLVTTPVNANRFKPTMDRAVHEENLKIQLLELQLPVAEVGLPEGCESFDLIQSAALFPKLFAAAALLKEPAENAVRGLTPPPSCIVSDNLFSWTRDIARKFDVPRLIFHGPGCFTYMCIHVVMNSNIFDEIVSDSEYFVLPGLKDRIELTKPQAAGWGRPDNKEAAKWFDGLREAEDDADGIVVNSFQELEPNYVEELAKAKHKKVWCIGPVSLCNKSLLDLAERGSKAGINEHDCLKWLDLRESGSVIYVCLGSLTRACIEQNIELGLGLESSNVPFIWCVRHANEELEKWFLEEGFEERVKDRGIIVRGWAPQVLILSHPAVGGFLTHCGWNSTLEGVSAGLPMVTWPQFADQFLNERFIVNILKTGVKIGMEVPVIVGEQISVLVKKDNITTAVKDVMGKEEEGEARRKRAKELAKMSKTAMEEGGSSYVNMTYMIQDIREKIAKNTSLLEL
ncbi:hypothetical protein OSB04_013959 [Centaurea solstitialis]|uniref:Glycosyltransferase N-terminal domain-containing protein n=1 Tax=Centaurea solstitialis TaxID=347529 RepID=A0AA38TQW4_9ASTR|nr:hypothetical protein OSB04_013959 [Centaurea solstitialis]